MVDQPSFPGTGRRVDDEGTFQAPGIVRDSPPELLPLPDLKDMVNLSNADLMQLLKRYGIQKPWPELVAQAQRYNADFTSMATQMDPERFAAAQATLLDLNARPDGRPSRGLLGLARRTQESYTTMEAIGGDPSVELARVSEIDDASCAGCLQLSDFDGTYAEHQAQGLPGSQECGNNCRCQLIRIESE